MIDTNWNIFKAKFNGKESSAFELLAYMLFCYEHNIEVGIFRFKNQTGIETEPIESNDKVIGFQAKFYITKLADNKIDVIDSLKKAKEKNQTLNKILIYTNQELSESSKKKQKKPSYQTEIENTAESIGVEIEWRLPSHIEKQLSVPKNNYIAQYFFATSDSIVDFLEKLKQHTENILFANCNPKCGERFKAEEANELFAKKLKEITFNEVSLGVLERFSYSLFQNGGLGAQEEIEKLKTEIERNKERLSNAQEMLLDKTLDPTDFKAIKSRYETTVYELEKRLRNISQEGNELDDYIRYGRVFFRSMDQFYQEGTLSVKQQLVGSMFPEKLIFENKTYRTIKENPLIPLTCRPDKGFGGSKNKKTGKIAGLSNKAPPSGLEPETL